MFNKPNRTEPGPGQESVWDYPRPPRIEPTSKRIRVIFNGETIADSVKAMRVLETSHPPGIYIPQTDIQMQYLHKTHKSTYCEFKGRASYWTVNVNGIQSHDAVWGYLSPTRGYEAIAGYLSLYPGLMDVCYVDDEQVTPQAGNFYGGWVTSDIVGPFKGGHGTLGW